MLRNLILLSVVAVSAFLLKIATNKLTDKRAEIVEEDSEVRVYPRKKRAPASVESMSRPQNNRNSGELYQPQMNESERQNPGFPIGEGDGELRDAPNTP
jgi:hypothetical protein